MEYYVGKICPYCKAEIKEGDAVTVCPSCGIAHHKACWDENRGCTTFGCSGQIPKMQASSEYCRNCGSALDPGQEFCSKCGARKEEKKKVFCTNCGTELEDGQAFCPKCGQKAGVQMDAGVTSAISEYNASVDTAKKKKSRAPLIIGIIAGIAVLAVVIYLLAAPKKPKSISLNKSEITIERGQTYTLSYDVAPEKATEYEVTWSSDDESVATVKDGVVSAELNGTCNVEVKTDNGVSDTCKVTVEMPQIEKRLVGTWRITSILDMDKVKSTAWSQFGWKLYLYDDNTAKVDTGKSDSTLHFVWGFSDTNSYGNDVYLSADDQIYFIYENDKREIWLYLQTDSTNLCLTCEK